MFQLYKKRGFSEFVGDTFDFLKIEGKNYFKNYFVINGIVLLLLVATLYFFTSIFFEGMFSNANRNNSNGMALFLNDNLGVFMFKITIAVEFPEAGGLAVLQNRPAEQLQLQQRT